MDDGNRTVVNLADIRPETSTSTSSSAGEQATRAPTSAPPQQNPPYNTYIPAPSGPFDNFNHIAAIWVVIGLLCSWLVFLTYNFYTESKEIRKDISDNQQDLIKLINSSQIDIKNQISNFERRHENDIRTLQKMILEQNSHRN